MQTLLDLINIYVGNPELARIIVLMIVSASAALLGMAGVWMVYQWMSPSKRRIKQILSDDNDHKPKPVNKDKKYDKIIDSASSYVLPKEGKELSKVRQDLIHAGFDSEKSSTIFFASKMILGIILPAIVLVASRFYPQYSTFEVFFAAGCVSFLGMLIPNSILSHLRAKRIKVLRQGFPDALDLLVVCVEAGLGLNAALKRVSDELAVSHKLLAQQLSIVNEEIRIGVDRVQALRNLAERTGLEDIDGLVSLLAQSLKFGTSIAETLRVYSAEFRDKRMQKAEEKAALIGTKLMFPLVVCVFPSFFLVMVGPAVVGVFKALGS